MRLEMEYFRDYTRPPGIAVNRYCVSARARPDWYSQRPIMDMTAAGLSQTEQEQFSGLVFDRHSAPAVAAIDQVLFESVQGWIFETKPGKSHDVFVARVPWVLVSHGKLRRNSNATGVPGWKASLSGWKAPLSKGLAQEVAWQG